MLTHKERMQLAEELCAGMVGKYPGQILLGGVYGSTPRGTDTLWSDLEMVFVVTDDCLAQGQDQIYFTIAVGYRVYKKKALEAILMTPSRSWPFHMGMLDSLHVLHGDPALIEEFLAIGQSVPLGQFHQALEGILPELMVESYGRIHSCRDRGNTYDVHLSIAEMLFEMRDALCLLNKRWVTYDYYQGLVQTYEFPKIPDKYQYLVPALYVVRDFDEIVPLAARLMLAFWHLMENEGIKYVNMLSVDEFIF